MGITCQLCGTENGDKQKFCSACGKPLEGAGSAGQSVPKHKSNAKAKTMVFGGAAASIGKEPQKPSPSKSAKPAAQKTMLGMAAVTAGSSSKDKKIPVAKISSPPPKPGGAKPTKGGGARTMVGMAAVNAGPTAGQKGSDSAKRPAHKSTGSQTVLGMPTMGVDFNQKSPPKHEDAPSADPSADADHAPDEIVDKVDEKPKSAAATEQLPTMSDSGENAMDIQTAPISSPFDEDDEDDENEYQDEVEEWPDEAHESSRANGLLIAVIAAGIVALLVVAALLYLLFFDAAPAVKPQIFPSPDGKSLVVSLPFPEAPAGSSIQAAGQTIQVVQGVAQVTLPLAQMKLGLNDIVLSYAEPGESPEQITFPIVLRHTIKDDFSGLAGDPPTVTVAFQIAPDVRLAVEGKPAQIVNNSYLHKIPIDKIAASGDRNADYFMHKVPFQLIDAQGTVEQGEHMVAVPVTKLQIDRPADNAQVVTESVTCAGFAESGAEVKVNGSPVAVAAARFNAKVPLEKMGDHVITVAARAPGKAPRSDTVKITRIESLEPAIAAWSTDLDKKLDYPTIGRDPNAHIGKKVKLNGRVVNINTEKGVTAFILYVGQGCPAKSKCAVYVVFKGETSAGLQSWVDVYGTVRGTRTVEMQNGVKIDVPAVDAVYVLKSEAKSGKKKK